MRSDPCLDQDPIDLAGTTPKKEGPRTSEAFFFCRAFGFYRTPQLGPGQVGANSGLVSQYIRVVKSSGPCRAIAASTLAEFTAWSVIEYRYRLGTVLMTALGP